MKATPTLLAILAATFLCSGCARQEAAPAEEKKSGAPEAHGTNVEVSVTLDAKAQQRIGLETVALTTTEFAPEARAVGRVLDPATLAGLVGEMIATRAAAEAGAKELERAKVLAQSDNVSARALQIAEASTAREAAQAEAARAKLIGALGQELGGQENLPALVKALASGARALVRLEFPPGEALPGPPASARLISVSAESQPTAAKFVGTATVDPQAQTRGLLFLVESNTPGFTAGEAVTGFITIPGERQAGAIIPRNAVVRKDGLAWAYVQTRETEFARREVATDRPADSGWFVTRNFSGGEKVVTTGAQILLSTEMSAGGSAEEESH